VLTASKPLADYFEAVAAQVDPSAAASWVVDVLQGELNYYGRTLDAISPDLLIDFITNVIQRTITKKAAVEGIRTVLVRSDENISLRVDEKAVLEIIDKAGLRIAPAEETITAVKQAIEENPQAVEDYHSGKTGALNFLVGRVMKKTRGRADPTLTNRLIREQL
jgi:aspartyl-tRNA(Asn)/glutamyl-tRNA(Gln) amidotransferase subunit B